MRKGLEWRRAVGDSIIKSFRGFIPQSCRKMRNSWVRKWDTMRKWVGLFFLDGRYSMLDVSREDLVERRKLIMYKGKENC